MRRNLRIVLWNVCYNEMPWNVGFSLKVARRVPSELAVCASSSLGKVECFSLTAFTAHKSQLQLARWHWPCAACACLGLGLHWWCFTMLMQFRGANTFCVCWCAQECMHLNAVWLEAEVPVCAVAGQIMLKLCAIYQVLCVLLCFSV
jgi:hypothetical protein